MKALITLDQIRAASPCEDEWKRLLKYSDQINRKNDEPFEITDIIKSNSIEEAVWALQALEGFEKEKRLFACDCAMTSIHIYEKHHPDDNRPRNAIEVARKFANGEASADELAAARDSAWDSARDSAWAAARDAAWDAARAAARDAAWDAARAAAWDSARDSARAAAWDSAWDAITKIFNKHYKNKDHVNSKS